VGEGMTERVGLGLCVWRDRVGEGGEVGGPKTKDRKKEREKAEER